MRSKSHSYKEDMKFNFITYNHYERTYLAKDLKRILHITTSWNFSHSKNYSA